MEPLEEGCYYHIYNRGAGKADIFWYNEDYIHFIKKYFYYLRISVETYAWCLLKNHFHVLIRIRTPDEQEEEFQSMKAKLPDGTFHGDHFGHAKPYDASRQLGHLFNSYTKYINLKKERSGTLIEGAFKRKRIMDDANFTHLACYIHRNPIHHGITGNYSEYKYSSYNRILAGENTSPETNKLLAQFGGRENFIKAHQEFKEMLGEDYYLED